MMHTPRLIRSSACLLAVALSLLLAAAPAARASEAQFLKDLKALTQADHRLSGSPADRAAADYVQQRLADIGIAEVRTLDMPVWQTELQRCEMQLGGKTIPLRPIRPNITIPPVTPEEGLTGPIIYAGKGGILEYGTRSPEGAIVLLDYESYANWRLAFSLGAKAVVFVGDRQTVSLEPKSVNLPTNLVRLWVDKADLAGIDLDKAGQLATLHSEVVWKPAVGRNIIARIRGTEADFSTERETPEAVVLSADLDSFGQVPHLSPGARGAANVAALLEAASILSTNPPKRDVLLMFLDGSARSHEGARRVYDAMLMADSTHTDVSGNHRAEREDLRRWRKLLVDYGAAYAKHNTSTEDNTAITERLKLVAGWAQDDLKKELQVIRLEWRTKMRALDRDDPEEAKQIEEMKAQLKELEAPYLEQQRVWDRIRRGIHDGELDRLLETQIAYTEGQFVDHESASATVAERDALRRKAPQHVKTIEELFASTIAGMDKRLEELELLTTIDQQRQALRDMTAAPGGDERTPLWINLHATYDFGDASTRWGVVVGDWTNNLYSIRKPGSGTDAPGYYVRLMGVVRDVARTDESLRNMEESLLRDPARGMSFAPGQFSNGGAVAGMFAIHNVSFMTGYDARVRDGHPADTVAALDWKRLRSQALEATGLVAKMASHPGLSLKRVFSTQNKSKFASWDSGRSSGDYARLRVSGSLAERRPAAGAMLAYWPARVGNVATAWASMSEARILDFDPFAITTIDQNGQFELQAIRRDVWVQIATLGTLFDERGAVRAITTQENLTQKLSAAMRVDLFLGEGYNLTRIPTYQTKPDQLAVLKAASSSELRENLTLWGQDDGLTFFYVADTVVDDRVKLFQPMGPVVLNVPEGRSGKEERYGKGLEAEAFSQPRWINEIVATDLWRLNETRLRRLRERGVTRADLELLHSRANRMREEGVVLAEKVAPATASQAEVAGEEAAAAAEPTIDAPGQTLADRESAFYRSASLSHRVYPPLRQSMDDLVYAVVVLLLLAIPFAFAMERLAVCATSIYGRILGFVAVFLITFGLLYWMHPGFAIASTPIIIFLAFAIILLSSLVIYIVVRKFRTELKSIQGQKTGVHELDVSTAGALLAAVGMGMSTMRRRPTRTTLTAVTVVMLTFTILCFASFTRTVGVRAVYEGPVDDTTAPGVLLRKIDYSALPDGVVHALHGRAGEGGLVADQWWLSQEKQDAPAFSVATPKTGDSQKIDALMGLDLRELERWPELAASLGSGDVAEKVKALANDGVYLPSVVAELLELKPGQDVLLNGYPARFVGTLDPGRLQQLKHLDGQSVLPADFKDPAAAATGQGGGGGGDSDELIIDADVQKDFVHLSADQIAVISKDFARRLGGKMHIITVYPGPQLDATELGKELAQVVVLPVWAAGPEGVERMILTVLTEVSGGMQLAVPLLLGGLIIFGTLLGSISDREREIYTFSALGLSPGHVGVLFFAEAAVYAVVGGMGGQLLGQSVALVAGKLSAAGVIDPVSINYSSTNSLFAIGVVMATVIVSAIYPAFRASKSANPGLARAWRMPPAEGDDLNVIFPFTVSAYDITGVVSFLAEHFRRHDDAGLGSFAASNVGIRRTGEGNLELGADLALAPFDLGVTERLTLTAVPSEIPGVDEVAIHAHRLSGARGDWYRANKVFMRDLRQQFLLWRTLTGEMIEHYRMETLQTLGEATEADVDRATPVAS